MLVDAITGYCASPPPPAGEIEKMLGELGRMFDELKAMPTGYDIADHEQRTKIANEHFNEAQRFAICLVAQWPALRSHIAAQVDEITRLREALVDATAHLAGAASAYRKHAARWKGLKPRAVGDALFTTRANDFDKAVERARAALRETPDAKRD